MTPSFQWAQCIKLNNNQCVVKLVGPIVSDSAQQSLIRYTTRTYSDRQFALCLQNRIIQGEICCAYRIE